MKEYRSIVESLSIDGFYMDCPYCGVSELTIEDIHIKAGDYKDGSSMKILCKNNHEWAIIVEKFARGIYIAVVTSARVKYAEYIKSSKWKEKADQAKEDADFRCQLCNAAGNETNLHAHHRTYERLGNELPEDITVLCADCHAKFHGIIE